MDASEWLEAYGVTFDWSATGYHADASGWEHHRYTVTLTGPNGATLESAWRQGMGITDDPTPAAVLSALSSDAAYGEMTWPEFADEFGYDEMEAPLSEYRTWEACKAFRDQLETFSRTVLGLDYRSHGGDVYSDFLELDRED